MINGGPRSGDVDPIGEADCLSDVLLVSLMVGVSIFTAGVIGVRVIACLRGDRRWRDSVFVAAAGIRARSGAALVIGASSGLSGESTLILSPLSLSF